VFSPIRKSSQNYNLERRANMSQRINIFGLTMVTMFGGVASFAAPDAPLGKDLKATIALQGFSCDQIINSKRNGDSDYFATCKDGNRYHVFVNPQGRVVVQKQ
jgi:hypothetical protein